MILNDLFPYFGTSVAFKNFKIRYAFGELIEKTRHVPLPNEMLHLWLLNPFLFLTFIYSYTYLYINIVSFFYQNHLKF